MITDLFYHFSHSIPARRPNQIFGGLELEIGMELLTWTSSNTFYLLELNIGVGVDLCNANFTPPRFTIGLRFNNFLHMPNSIYKFASELQRNYFLKESERSKSKIFRKARNSCVHLQYYSVLVSELKLSNAPPLLNSYHIHNYHTFLPSHFPLGNFSNYGERRRNSGKTYSSFKTLIHAFSFSFSTSHTHGPFS